MLGLVRLREGIVAYPQKPAAAAVGIGFGLGPRATSALQQSAALFDQIGGGQ